MRRRRNGRMLVAATAIAISVPLLYFALERPAGQWLAFSVLFGFGCVMMYVYYATVYSTIQDVIEPSLRATAMALYFCAMYAFGGAIGPLVIGTTSDYYAHQKAVADDVDMDSLESVAKLPYRGHGLHSAMYLLPLVNVLLAGVLFAGAKTVGRDSENLQRWMREHSERIAGERGAKRSAPSRPAPRVRIFPWSLLPALWSTRPFETRHTAQIAALAEPTHSCGGAVAGPASMLGAGLVRRYHMIRD